MQIIYLIYVIRAIVAMGMSLLGAATLPSVSHAPQPMAREGPPVPIGGRCPWASAAPVGIQEAVWIIVARTHPETSSIQLSFRGKMSRVSKMKNKAAATMMTWRTRPQNLEITMNKSALIMTQIAENGIHPFLTRVTSNNVAATMSCVLKVIPEAAGVPPNQSRPALDQRQAKKKRGSELNDIYFDVWVLCEKVRNKGFEQALHCFTKLQEKIETTKAEVADPNETTFKVADDIAEYMSKLSLNDEATTLGGVCCFLHRACKPRGVPCQMAVCSFMIEVGDRCCEIPSDVPHERVMICIHCYGANKGSVRIRSRIRSPVEARPFEWGTVTKRKDEFVKTYLDPNDMTPEPTKTCAFCHKELHVMCTLYDEFNSTLAYIDSVNLLQPDSQQRSVFQHTILVYMDYVRRLGYENLNIWICPPKPAHEYVFYGRPAEDQKCVSGIHTGSPLPTSTASTRFFVPPSTKLKAEAAMKKAAPKKVESKKEKASEQKPQAQGTQVPKFPTGKGSKIKPPKLPENYFDEYVNDWAYRGFHLKLDPVYSGDRARMKGLLSHLLSKSCDTFVDITDELFPQSHCRGLVTCVFTVNTFERSFTTPDSEVQSIAEVDITPTIEPPPKKKSTSLERRKNFTFRFRILDAPGAEAITLTIAKLVGACEEGFRVTFVRCENISGRSDSRQDARLRERAAKKARNWGDLSAGSNEINI